MASYDILCLMHPALQRSGTRSRVTVGTWAQWSSSRHRSCHNEPGNCIATIRQEHLRTISDVDRFARIAMNGYLACCRQQSCRRSVRVVLGQTCLLPGPSIPLPANDIHSVWNNRRQQQGLHSRYSDKHSPVWLCHYTNCMLTTKM